MPWVWVRGGCLACTNYQLIQLSGKHTHTHTQPFNGLWSGITRVGWYRKKHSLTHTHPDHRASFIIFLHLQRSMTYTLFTLRAWQSSRTTVSRSSLVFLLVLHPHLHTPYISSPNHHLPYYPIIRTNGPKMEVVIAVENKFFTRMAIPSTWLHHTCIRMKCCKCNQL